MKIKVCIKKAGEVEVSGKIYSENVLKAIALNPGYEYDSKTKCLYVYIEISQDLGNLLGKGEKWLK